MINLHSVVRTVVNTLHPDEYVTWYRFIGAKNVRGRLISNVVDPNGVTVLAQIQTLGADELRQAEEVNKTQIQRKAYLFAGSIESEVPNGIVRIFAREGDFLHRSDGTWWLITSLMEDFRRSGWVSVGITMQINPPVLSEASDD